MGDFHVLGSRLTNDQPVVASLGGMKPADLHTASLGSGVPVATLRRWIHNKRLIPLRYRPCMVDLDQILEVIEDIGPGRNRARKREGNN